MNNKLLLVALFAAAIPAFADPDMDEAALARFTAQARAQQSAAPMLGLWRKLPECRPGDGGRQNITSTMELFADGTAEIVIISYRGHDTSCAEGRIGRTVAKYEYSVDGPSATEPGAVNTTWKIISVKVTANNGDVWDRTDEFGGKVSRNTAKIVTQNGVSFYYVSEDDSSGKVQSKPSYVRVR